MKSFRIRLVAALSPLLAGACLDGGASRSPLAPGSLPDAPQFIINGTPTGSAFGNVGVVAFDFNGNGTIEGSEFICSGSLISPTVFLTAAHCLAFLPASAKLGVSFGPDLLAAGLTMIAAQSFAFDPAFGHDEANPHDIGVVIVPAQTITPVQLPTAGQLDQLNVRNGLKDQLFVNVGYGASATRTGPPAFPLDFLRKLSESPFQALRPSWLVLSMNTSATGLGGDCYGDSGSPKFLAGTNRIVAITVTGDLPCRATSVDYRLDTSAAQSFLAQYVTLP
jgi:trypsin